jgi:hypothetical protein
MKHTSVVPDHDVTDLPLVAVDALGGGRPDEEIVEEGPSLVAPSPTT